MHFLSYVALAAISSIVLPMNVSSGQTGGCKLIASGDPAFDARIGEKSAASLSDKAVASIRHDSVLILNESSKTVVAYLIRWTLSTSSGAFHTLDSAYAEPSILTTHRAGGDSGIAPGAARLLHPNFNVSTEEFARSVANPKLAELANSQNQLGDVVSAELDGVIFDDGTFYGPDKSDYFLKFRTGLNARHDAGVRVLTLLKEGKTDAEIIVDLERQASERPQYGAAPAHDYYYYQRSFEAEQLLNVYRQLGRDALIKNATYQRREPKHTLVKANNPE